MYNNVIWIATLILTHYIFLFIFSKQLPGLWVGGQDIISLNSSFFYRSLWTCRNITFPFFT